MARRSCILKGVVAGLAGGLVASWVMNEFQAGWSAAAKRLKLKASANSHDDSYTDSYEDSQTPRPNSEDDDAEDATMKTANNVSSFVFGKELNKEEKKKAGPLVHYAFGTLMGGLYGGLAEKLSPVKAGFGLPFGAALFIVADEVAVPALGLSSQSPAETKPEDHLYGLVSHFVYGATIEVVRRNLRSVM